MANDLLIAGREAISRRDWSAAIDAFERYESDAGTVMAAEDLGLKADAMWWAGRPDEAVEIFERAFSEYEREGKKAQAAEVAALLAYFAHRRRAYSVAAGWGARARRLTEGEPESTAHAWVALLGLAQTLLGRHDLAATIVEADDVVALAARLGLPGIHALAMSFKGIAMISLGDWRGGVELVDEASAIAMSTGADLRAASDVYCNTIAACRNLADYGRAGEWTEQAERWMRSNGVGGYTGICQVHRAELKRIHGAWPEAEEEARRACVELEKFHIDDGIGYAHYEIGEVRRRMGDLEAAEESFALAYEHGMSAQPGRALLLLDRGEVEEAAKSIARALENRAPQDIEAPPPLSRGWMLPAQVEIALAADDLDTARSAVAELERFVEHYENRTWRAILMTCAGSVHLAEGRLEDAVEALTGAVDLWREIELPYEGARARMLLGQAKQGVGDLRSADLEFRAARSALQKLGARVDLRRLESLSGTGAGQGVAGERVTETFMFTDIVTSTDLIGVIGDAAWENLLRWHDRSFREVLAAHNGTEVRHTGDGFFASFDEPGDAIACAVALQRTLDTNRREHGFAPQVRIGIHLAEATRKGGDYSGQGVHAAARIGELAQGDEIVVSAVTLDQAGALPYGLSPGIQRDLKGMSEAVMTHSLDWH